MALAHSLARPRFFSSAYSKQRIHVQPRTLGQRYIMRALLFTFLLALPSTGEQLPALDLGVPCSSVDWPALDVMEALGFTIQGQGRIGSDVHLRQTYNTKDWSHVWGKVKHPLKSQRGLFVTTSRTRPFETILYFYDYKSDWRSTAGRCKIQLEMDFSGHRETLFTERRERFQSTGELEARILDLIRWQLIAKGVIPE